MCFPHNYPIDCKLQATVYYIQCQFRLSSEDTSQTNSRNKQTNKQTEITCQSSLSFKKLHELRCGEVFHHQTQSSRWDTWREAWLDKQSRVLCFANPFSFIGSFGQFVCQYRRRLPPCVSLLWWNIFSDVNFCLLFSSLLYFLLCSKLTPCPGSPHIPPRRHIF